jgi:hypothetical protein
MVVYITNPYCCYQYVKRDRCPLKVTWTRVSCGPPIMQKLFSARVRQPLNNHRGLQVRCRKGCEWRGTGGEEGQREEGGRRGRGERKLTDGGKSEGGRCGPRFGMQLWWA